MTAAPERVTREWQVWMRSGRCHVVAATGQRPALREAERVAEKLNHHGADLIAVKAVPIK